MSFRRVSTQFAISSYDWLGHFEEFVYNDAANSNLNPSAAAPYLCIGAVQMRIKDSQKGRGGAKGGQMIFRINYPISDPAYAIFHATPMTVHPHHASTLTAPPPPSHALIPPTHSTTAHTPTPTTIPTTDAQTANSTSSATAPSPAPTPTPTPAPPSTSTSAAVTGSVPLAPTPATGGLSSVGNVASNSASSISSNSNTVMVSSISSSSSSSSSSTNVPALNYPNLAGGALHSPPGAYGPLSYAPGYGKGLVPGGGGVVHPSSYLFNPSFPMTDVALDWKTIAQRTFSTRSHVKGYVCGRSASFAVNPNCFVIISQDEEKGNKIIGVNEKGRSGGDRQPTLLFSSGGDPSIGARIFFRFFHRMMPYSNYPQPTVQMYPTLNPMQATSINVTVPTHNPHSTTQPPPQSAHAKPATPQTSPTGPNSATTPTGAPPVATSPAPPPPFLSHHSSISVASAVPPALLSGVSVSSAGNFYPPAGYPPPSAVPGQYPLPPQQGNVPWIVLRKFTVNVGALECFIEAADGRIQIETSMQAMHQDERMLSKRQRMRILQRQMATQAKGMDDEEMNGKKEEQTGAEDGVSGNVKRKRDHDDGSGDGDDGEGDDLGDEDDDMNEDGQDKSQQNEQRQQGQKKAKTEGNGSGESNGQQSANHVNSATLTTAPLSLTLPSSSLTSAPNSSSATALSASALPSSSSSASSSSSPLPAMEGDDDETSSQFSSTDSDDQTSTPNGDDNSSMQYASASAATSATSSSSSVAVAMKTQSAANAINSNARKSRRRSKKLFLAHTHATPASSSASSSSSAAAAERERLSSAMKLESVAASGSISANVVDDVNGKRADLNMSNSHKLLNSMSKGSYYLNSDAQEQSMHANNNPVNYVHSHSHAATPTGVTTAASGTHVINGLHGQMPINMNVSHFYSNQSAHIMPPSGHVSTAFS